MLKVGQTHKVYSRVVSYLESQKSSYPNACCCTVVFMGLCNPIESLVTMLCRRQGWVSPHYNKIKTKFGKLRIFNSEQREIF